VRRRARPHIREIAGRLGEGMLSLAGIADGSITAVDLRGPPALALTFDDGPSPHNTPVILDVLREHGARGTFFIVGSLVEGAEEIVARTAAEGHELANHSFTHPHTIHLSRPTLREELVRTNRVLETYGLVRLVRPPFGKDRRRIARVARELGLTVVLWSIDSGDTRGRNADEIVETVSAAAASGAIVLFHDGHGRREATLEATRKLVPRLRSDGFELVTVSELVDRASAR
jgi:peptidoglycan-N-acetylglucosamine deacetylase